MATIAKLAEENRLFQIEPDLDPGVMPHRYMYAIPEFRGFLDDVHQLESLWKQEQTPREQLDDLLVEFLGTEPFTIGRRFAPIYPARGKIWPGVWELKTPDLRIFGWFPRQNTFIAVKGSHAQKLKDFPALYGVCRDEVVRVRNELPLDEPKYIAGEEYSDVVSLIYRP